MPLFPEKDPLDEMAPVHMKLTRRLWNRIVQIAHTEGKSRTEVVAFFLQWACDDYERAKQAMSHKK